MTLSIERFGEKMVELLPQMLRGFARRESNYLSRGKITIPQLSVLELLSRERNCPMNRVAEVLNVTRPAATGLLDRLIAQGLAARYGDRKDRRVIRVNLTPKGRRILANIWNEKKRMIISVFGQLSPARREQYLGTLEHVVRILNKR